MHNWNGDDDDHYPDQVVSRPLRRMVRSFILFSLIVVSTGALLFGAYAGVKVIREVIANPRAYQTKPSAHHGHAHSNKGQRP